MPLLYEDHIIAEDDFSGSLLSIVTQIPQEEIMAIAVHVNPHTRNTGSFLLLEVATFDFKCFLLVGAFLQVNGVIVVVDGEYILFTLHDIN